MANTVSFKTAKGSQITVTATQDGTRVSINGTDRGICTIKRYNPSYAEIIIPNVGTAPVDAAAVVDQLKGLVAAIQQPISRNDTANERAFDRAYNEGAEGFNPHRRGSSHTYR